MPSNSVPTGAPTPSVMVGRAGRRHRRAWVGHGKAHIEVRTATRVGSGELSRAILDSVRALDGVRWVEVNAVIGRLMVAFDEEQFDVGEAVDLIDTIEEAHGAHDESFSFDRADHPGDIEPQRRALAAIVADVAGLGVGLFGSALQSTPFPIELASLFTLLDNEPRLRRYVENALGPSLADLTLAGVNAVAQGLAQGPLGLLVDALQRSVQYAEASSCRQCWEAFEAQMEPAGRGRWDTPLDRTERPVPLPPGPIELYTDRAALASLAAAAITAAATLSPRRSAAVLIAGIPKAARVGRETFAAHVGRSLTKRGVVVADPRALRRLDRVDTLCIDARSILTGDVVVDRLELLPGADRLQVQQRVRALFDSKKPGRVNRRGSWAVGPFASVVDRDDREGRRAADRLGGSEALYALMGRGKVAAVFTVAKELAPGARELIALAKQRRLMVAIAGDDLGLIGRLGADLLVDSGDALADSVRTMQHDECVVMLVTGDDPAALQSSDVGIGVCTDRRPLVWGAHLMVSGGLKDIAWMIDGAAAAYEVSRQSAVLGLVGAGVGSVLAVTARAGAAKQAMTTVNIAALAAIVNSTRASLALSRRPGLTVRQPIPWHELDVAEVFDLLGVSPEGLSPDGTRRRDLSDTHLPSAPMRFVRAIADELANPLTPVLAGGAALSAAVGSNADAVVIAGVTGLNALLGAGQRQRAERAIGALDVATRTTIGVRNGSQVTQIPADAVCPGMVIVLETGSVVPADARIVEANGLQVDESSVTGESVPTVKTAEPCYTRIVADRACMVYEGTTVVAGDADAVVVAVGADTEAAAVLDGDATPVARRSGVNARLARLSAVTLPLAAAGGVGVVASGLLRGQPLSRTLGAGVSLAVAAVPEGLPMLATAAQLASARRLSTRGALVRVPQAIEALGRVEVLCTDKTGTLTEGQINLQRVSDGEQDLPVDELTDGLRHVVAAARRATPAPVNGAPLVHPTDQAIITGAARCSADTSLGASGWERRLELPFEPSRGYHATVGSQAGGALLSVKGAPETVLPRCSTVRGSRGSITLDAARRRRLDATVDKLARRGLRILGVAECATTSNPDAIGDAQVQDLEFLGFVALADPVRPSAAAAVDGLRRAGVAVVMVTGDHPSTAEGIAAELGILGGRHVMTGVELEQLDDVELAEALATVSVFARVTPADKVRIVRAYQATGRAVAMTGDGANDAAAIRLADAGLAIGAAATPAARNAADVVITDGRIETIVDTIVEGRAMWGSVRDGIAILLGGNLGEIVFTVGAAAVTGRPPLTSRQLLLVNLLTDIAPSLAIAVRPPHNRSYEDLLHEGPDRSLGASLNRTIALRAVTTAGGAGVAWTIASLTGGQKRAGTVGLVALVATQLGQTLTSGGSHPSVVAAGVGSAAVLAAIVQTPGVSQFFGCTPLDPLAWATAIGTASGACVVGFAAPHVVNALGRVSTDWRKTPAIFSTISKTSK